VAQVYATANSVAATFSVTANYGPVKTAFVLTNQGPFSVRASFGGALTQLAQHGL
jgi:hypothetical protein